MISKTANTQKKNQAIPLNLTPFTPTPPPQPSHLPKGGGGRRVIKKRINSERLTEQITGPKVRVGNVTIREKKRKKTGSKVDDGKREGKNPENSSQLHTSSAKKHTQRESLFDISVREEFHDSCREGGASSRC